MNKAIKENRNVGGRPPKFDEPSRPVTITLPESALDKLALIDPDRAQAVVKLARAAVPESGEVTPLAQIVTLAEGAGVVIVGPSQTLRKIPFLHLLEISPGRYLLALAPGHDFKALELSLVDVLGELPASDARERALVEELIVLIGHVRRSYLGRTAEILLVDPAR